MTKFNDEITDSLMIAVKKRINSPLYGTFVIYWLIFHWNLIITIFFVSEDKIWDSMHLFKNDYLIKTFFDYSDFWFWADWVLPVLLTYLTIWVFPKYIAIPAFKREEIDETEKNIFKLEEERKIVHAKTLFETEKTKEITAVMKNVEEEQKIRKVDPTFEWEDDYITFEKSRHYFSYSTFLDNFYSGHRFLHQFSSADVAYYDALGLLEMGQNQINGLTAKGKYFALKVKSKV